MREYRYEPVDQAENIAVKQRVVEIMQRLMVEPVKSLEAAIRAGYHADAQVNVTHPVNAVTSLDAIRDQLWGPLRAALPDVERRDDIVAGGRYQDAHWIGCLGHYVGTFEKDWVGIPATGGIVAVRYAEGHAVRGDKIAASYVFIDFLDLMRQAGYWPIAPSLGQEMRWLPPLTHDGILLTPQDNAVSQRTIERVLRMHAALAKYPGPLPTREALDAMAMVEHWHPHFIWSGPAGIGTTRGLKAFEDYHQIPFVMAFPDRGGTGAGHFIRIGDGAYAVTGGWGYLQGTHLGSGFLGLPPTGKRVTMRVMDFYRCDDSTIVENWVPWDIPHLLLQLGVDVFARLRYQFARETPNTNHWLIPA